MNRPATENVWMLAFYLGRFYYVRKSTGNRRGVMHPVIGRCPICHDELAVTRLQCRNCGTSVEGEFSLGPLQRLSQDQVRFVEAFVRNRGSLKDVGGELNMSYPTVNSRLNDI